MKKNIIIYFVYIPLFHNPFSIQSLRKRGTVNWQNLKKNTLETLSYYIVNYWYP